MTNAARLFARTPSQLEQAVKRLSEHLSDPQWDHRDWAAAVLAEQARHIQEDDLIPLDATELAKTYARRMQYQCTIRDASRVGDPLVNYALRWRAEDAKRFLGQVWHVERFLTRSFLALERMLWCVVLAGGFLAWLQCRERCLCRQLETEVLYWDKPYKIPGCRMARDLQAIAGQAGCLALPNNA